MIMKQMLMAGVLAVMLAGAGEAADADRGRGVELIHVGSRVFESARYDNAKQSLILVFNDGAAYLYYDVPRQVYLDFSRIVNKGEYFSRHIRGHYNYVRLTGYPASWANID